MDTLTLMISIVLMMLFMQYGQFWLVFGVLMITILTSRSFSTTFVILTAVVAVYLTKDLLKDLWLIVTIGLITLALILSIRKPERPEYAPEMGLGGMFGQEGFG